MKSPGYSRSPSIHSTYMPQLDALRLFAVLGVMITHNWHPRRLPWLFGDIDLGGLGVRLFFVLSGFLITSILLDCRDQAEAGTTAPALLVRQFYIRRFLRIFPIYYLVLFLAVLLNVSPARQVWPWFAGFATNVYVTFIDPQVGRLGHFWTLAVEEQFYLLWPVLVMFVPRRKLVGLILAAILLAPAFRLFAFYAFPIDIGHLESRAGTLPMVSLDTLGMGSLLAWLWRSGIRRDLLERRLALIVLPAGAVLYLTVLALYHYHISPVICFTLVDLGLAMVLMWLVHSAAVGFRGPLGRLLSSQPVVYLGKLTYGIYIFHNLAPLVLAYVFSQAGLAYRIPSFTNFSLSTGLSVVFAIISWHLLEGPINRLKRHFPYQPVSSSSFQGSDLARVET